MALAHATAPAFIVDHNTLLENIEICTGITVATSADWLQVYDVFDKSRDSNHNVKRFVKFFDTQAHKSFGACNKFSFGDLCMPEDARLFATVMHYYFGF